MPSSGVPAQRKYLSTGTTAETQTQLVGTAKSLQKHTPDVM